MRDDGYLKWSLSYPCARGFSWKFSTRLQNSSYFCVSKYARAVKQKVYGRVRLAWDSYATLYRFLYWFWEKNRLFCSLIFHAFERASEATRFRLFAVRSLFLSLMLRQISRQMSGTRETLSLTKETELPVISRHTNRTYLEKIPDLYLSAPSLALPFACLSAAGIPVK